MSTGRKRSLSGLACSSPAKRKKYLCKYQKAWEAEFSWLSHSDRSVNDAYCILCKSHLSIGSSYYSFEPGKEIPWDCAGW